MFNFFKRKKNDVPTETILQQLIALTFSDEELSKPVYLPEIKTESDAEHLGIGPLIYIWNVNHDAKSYTLSVNGKCVGHLLETFIPRTNPSFPDVRDAAMLIIYEVSQGCVSTMIEKTGLMPDLIFGNISQGQ